MRKTKIVCTLGPASETEEMIRILINAGMNVARLNFSHGNRDEHFIKSQIIKKVRNDLNIPVALLLDTKGPEVRLKTFKNGKITLNQGDLFTLTTDDIEGDNTRVSVTYKNLSDDVNQGDRLLIDDGLIALKILSKQGKNIQCEIINGGVLSDKKSINFPGIAINLPFISENDYKDIVFAIDNDFDFIAASFVRNAECVLDIRKILKQNQGTHIKIISKIENREGLDNIDEIIKVSDGIMVARGDMGVEIPFEELPAIQKKIIKKCLRVGKPVITATQMLDSMIRNPRPTRAEITDVANAIYDGTSAIMLSGETSVGDYPVESLKTMSTIAIETETHINQGDRFDQKDFAVNRNIPTAISHATCLTAHNLGADAIISVTKSGKTAIQVSRFRPACPIIATTIEPQIQRQLALYWGVYPILTDKKYSIDDVFNQAVMRSIESGLIANGDLVVITGGMPIDMIGTTNTMRIYIVGDILAEGKGYGDHKVTGPLCVVHNDSLALQEFNTGDILVMRKTTDEILKVIKNAAAIVTEENETYSQAIIIGKALQIPMITGVKRATEKLKSGIIVTVDPTKGHIYLS